MTARANIVWSVTGCIVALVLSAAAAARAQTPPAPPWEAPLARQAPLTGEIREPASGRRLTPEQLLDRLAGADFVLLGERHDNPDHHRLQAWAVDSLLTRAPRYAVALEMIDSDQAARLSQYLAASPQNSAQLGTGAELGRQRLAALEPIPAHRGRGHAARPAGARGQPAAGPGAGDRARRARGPARSVRGATAARSGGGQSRARRTRRRDAGRPLRQAARAQPGAFRASPIRARWPYGLGHGRSMAPLGAQDGRRS